jgi:hypothetical protein
MVRAQTAQRVTVPVVMPGAPGTRVRREAASGGNSVVDPGFVVDPVHDSPLIDHIARISHVNVTTFALAG